MKLVALRDEADDENPLAAASRASCAGDTPLARIFGNAPGAYGAGAEDLLGRDLDPAEVGAAYLAAGVPCLWRRRGRGPRPAGAFAERVRAADLLLHGSDDPARDLLEGSEDAAFIGGFASAAASLGNAPELIVLDVTDAKRPRARTLDAALARIVRSRAVNPRFIAGQMRHGARGAAELAETVDRLVDFAETTGKVASALFDLVHDAYLGDSRVRDFPDAREPASRPRHRRAAGGGAAQGAVASAPQRPRHGFERASLRGRGGRDMSSPFARGACPRLSEPMQTGDGLLARIVTAGPIPLDAFSRLCAAAREHGNGVMEISARGSLQVRGLTPHSAPLFASAVASLDIDLGDGAPVIADPLAGDPASLIDANALAADLRRAIADSRRVLAPKVSVVVDGGGAPPSRCACRRSPLACRRDAERADAARRARRRCRLGDGAGPRGARRSRRGGDTASRRDRDAWARSARPRSVAQQGDRRPPQLP